MVVLSADPAVDEDRAASAAPEQLRREVAWTADRR